MSLVCNQTNGLCDCRDGVSGLMCDACLDEYFNLTSDGCQPCECSELATSQTCNKTTGMCTCLATVAGDKCDECQDEYYNLTQSGCTSCLCDPSGSASLICDKLIGQCTCVENTVERDCSACSVGYFRTNSQFTGVCEECKCLEQTQECSQDMQNYTIGTVSDDFTVLCSMNEDCVAGWRILNPSQGTEEFFFPGYECTHIYSWTTVLFGSVVQTGHCNQ